MAAPLRYLYNNYSKGAWVRTLHRIYMNSPLTARWHFGVDCPPLDVAALYDITTILLKWHLKPILKEHRDWKVLEIGVGPFAILSGYLSQFTNQPIDTFDIRKDLVESALKTQKMNRLDNVNIFQSDLFANVPEGSTYDLMFWNLPYYADPEKYLAGLFEQAPPFLAPGGTMVLGYNSKPLPRARVLEILERYPKLRLADVRTYPWNMHELVTVALAYG
ncbi:MAG: methyltransferase [Verrucomicrobiales bacterium]|nr:methyltransferase [Verrucomicrobiae bacterium]